VQTALEVGLLPVALVESGAKNDPHAELWIVARARLVRVSDRYVLADEQIDVLISNPELPGSEKLGAALLKERTEEIQSKLDQLAAQVVSRVLPHARAVDAIVAADAQPDSGQDSDIDAPNLPR
jgi:hypothetical protein